MAPEPLVQNPCHEQMSVKSGFLGCRGDGVHHFGRGPGDRARFRGGCRLLPPRSPRRERGKYDSRG